MLLLVTGDSVLEELFYDLANRETIDAGDGLNLDNNLHGTDNREVLPGFFDDTTDGHYYGEIKGCKPYNPFQNVKYRKFFGLR